MEGPVWRVFGSNLACVAVLLLAGLLLRPARAQAPQPSVFVGGLNGFERLADARSSAGLRQTGRAGLYLHYNATDPGLYGTALPGIAAAFSTTGPAMAELGLFHPGFFSQEWKSRVIQPGFHVGLATVNIVASITTPLISDVTLGQFAQFVREGTAAGLSVMAPVITPNAGQLVAYPFADSYWDGARTAALIGHGWALDTPAGLFVSGFTSPIDLGRYQQFVTSAITWATAHHIASIVILSPYHDGSAFADHAKAEYQLIVARGSLPTAWVLENYDAGQGPTASNPAGDQSVGAGVGTDVDPNSVAGVALWFARNGRTAGLAALPAAPHQ